jgi:hypothetical protein
MVGKGEGQREKGKGGKKERERRASGGNEGFSPFSFASVAFVRR